MGTTSIPTIELIDQRNQRVTVAPRSSDDLVGELADALGIDARAALELDGRVVGRHEPLARAGVRHGSRLTIAGPLSEDGEESALTVVVTAEAGPSAGRSIALGTGQHVIGRSPSAAVLLADPALEAHHAQLDVGPGGSVRLLQLTGRVTGRVDGEPLDGPTSICAEQRITLGTSRLRVAAVGDPRRRPAALSTDSADPWRRTLHRTPRLQLRWDPAPVAVPVEGAGPTLAVSSHLGVTAAVCTLIGSVLVAVLMRSPMFLVLGAVGVVAAIGMWVASRIGARRAERRAGAQWRQELAAFAAAVDAQRTARWRHHAATAPTIVDALSSAMAVDETVWARRADHPDAQRVTLGWGPMRWDVAVERPPGAVMAPQAAAIVTAAERFADVPITYDLGPGSTLAVTGPEGGGVVRSLIVQLATWLGPADWWLLVVADEPDDWDWARWLPHGPGRGVLVVAADDLDGQSSAVATFDDGEGRHLLVVTDRPELLTQRTGVVRRFISAAASIAVVVRVPVGDAVPAMCRSVLDIGSIGLARWRPDAGNAMGAAQAIAVHVAGLSVDDALRAALRLAGLSDPEDPARATDALASSITLGALCEEHGPGPIDDAIAIAARWRAAGPDPAPTAALGLAADGVVEIDLVRDGPHALVAGTTGSGKSELLRTLVVSLAARCSPNEITFVLVDYKGGSTFDACADLPHTVGVVTDLDDRLAERALCSLDAEVRRRERLLRAVGATDLAAYRSDPTRAPLPRLVVVIDEFAVLAAELPTFLSALVGVAQRGRSLGLHLILATQRPAGVVDDEIRANANLRLALRLHDAADARDVVGDDAPARFSRGTPGRAMLRLGPDDTVVFQSARCTGPATTGRQERLHVRGPVDGDPADGASELAILVRSIRNAAVLSDVPAPYRPWLEPLPSRVERVAPGAIGLIDVPAEQRRIDLRWTPAAGNLALIGAIGSGTTTSLLSLLTALLDRWPVHAYVIDARGDDRLDALVGAAQCGGILRPHEAERLARLLDRLVGELDRRRSADRRADQTDIVLAVDGVPGLRAALDSPADGTRWEQLQRIVGEGPAVGVTCLLTAERPTAMPGALLAACADRWIFHLDDPTEASMCGVRPSSVPGAIAGRLVIASSGCAAQVAALTPRPAERTVPPELAIGVLPRSVDADALPAGTATERGDLDLVLGIDHATLDVARLVIPDGEHVLVAGPSRSGRTTALARLLESWRDARPDGRVVVVGHRRGPLAAEPVPPGRVIDAVAGDQPTIVVVDDAEHVDDPALAALVGEHRPGLLIVAAGRPVTLRALYGHWTSVLRRSRLGLLMAACADTDGDVLGELLPRHRPLPARPGLAWVVDGGERRLVQIAWHPEHPEHPERDET